MQPVVDDARLGVVDGWKLGHRPGLDQLRGVAVLIVIAGHSAGVLGWRNYAGVGVDVFFVLSGFLITRLLLEERDRAGRVGFRSFYERRARRLLPALGAGLVLCALVNAAIGVAILGPILSAVTYTANYVQAARPDWGGSTRHLWSLAIEEHFYLAWPLVVGLTPRRWLVAVCASGVAVVVVMRAGTLLAGDTELAYRATHLRADGLLIGAGLAVLVPLIPRPSRVSIVAAAGAVAVVFLIGHPSDAWADPLVYLATVVLIVGAMNVRRRPRLERIGHLSYGLYLYQGAVLVLCDHFLEPTLAVAVALVGGWVLAVLSSQHLEARWLRRSGPEPLALEDAVGGHVDRSVAVGGGVAGDELDVVTFSEQEVLARSQHDVASRRHGAEA